MTTTYRVRTHLTGLPGGEGLCQMNFEFVEDIESVLDDVRQFWVGMASAISTEVEIFVDPEINAFESTTGVIGAFGTGSPPAVVLGTNTSDPLPWATQLLISWRTGLVLGGRRLRGRTFVPGLCENVTAGGLFTSAVTGQAVTAGEALVDQASSNLVVFSPTHLTTGQVTGVSASPVPAVLRSRRS